MPIKFGTRRRGSLAVEALMVVPIALIMVLAAAMPAFASGASHEQQTEKFYQHWDGAPGGHQWPENYSYTIGDDAYSKTLHDLSTECDVKVILDSS